jgi:putative tryptophan/tyrosine transport system substrate-binding protein
MKRLFSVLLIIAVLSGGAIADAQPAKKIPRIGFLIAPSRSFFSSRADGFRQGLHNLGYVEGKNIVIEYRYAEGKFDRLPELAAELVSLKVDVIVASGPSSWAAKNATKTIPIVFLGVQDPVASGLVDSLAMPGGNVTGLSILGPELGGKRLELLKEVVPKITRIAFLWALGGPGAPITVKETQAAARTLRLEFQPLEVRDAKDFDRAFQAITRTVLRVCLRTRVHSSIRITRALLSSPRRTGYRRCIRRPRS